MPIIDVGMLLEIPEQAIHKRWRHEVAIFHGPGMLLLHLLEHLLMIAEVAASRIQEEAGATFPLLSLLLNSVQMLIQQVLLMLEMPHKHTVHCVQSRGL